MYKLHSKKFEEYSLMRQAKYVGTTAPVAHKAVKDKQASTAILAEVDEGISSNALPEDAL